MSTSRSPLRRFWHSAWLICLLSFSVHARDTRNSLGELHVDVDGTVIDMLTYRPPQCATLAVFFSIHGLKRNAKSARERAIPFADATCMMVFAPHFDEERFPNWRFHRAGVVRSGKVQDKARWTAPILLKLIEVARREVGADTPVYLFGHSAGAQFLSRIAAYTPLPDVARIVVANPSAQVAPVLDEDAPYGFGEIFSEFEAYAALKAYLASPITVLLGQQDTGTKYLADSKAAMRQGKNRLERGRYIFRQAREAASKRNWAFNWRLVEAPGIGHSSEELLRSPLLYQALGVDSKLPLPAAVGQF